MKRISRKVCGLQSVASYLHCEYCKVAWIVFCFALFGGLRADWSKLSLSLMLMVKWGP
jgi:hypothetical protein